ncbi:hypothetical protein HAZT_HAZT001774, partial [Hyalella azteca]
GPPGAFAGGVGAEVAIDSTITAVDSVIKEFEPYGVLEPLGDPTNPGKWCDAVGGMVIDGVTGRCAGKVDQRSFNKMEDDEAEKVDKILEDACAEEAKVSFKLNGSVLEVYHKEKLVAI